MRLIMTTSRGMFLLEALLALIVFAFGMLGLLALLVNALRESGSAHWRSEASDLASATLSGMWAQDSVTLAPRYDAATEGPGYRALLASAMRLPGVSARVNAPLVTIDDSGSGGKRVSVTVYWQAPAEPNAHRESVTAALPLH